MTYLVYGLFCLGLFFILTAGLGLVRFPSLFPRMQAVSKASTLGVIFMTLGLAIEMASVEVKVKGILICFFLLLTAPIAAHAIAVSARKSGCDQ
jgi:multicomponent Na+:H+ antiporter subunit G